MNGTTEQRIEDVEVLTTNWPRYLAMEMWGILDAAWRSGYRRHCEEVKVEVPSWAEGRPLKRY